MIYVYNTHCNLSPNWDTLCDVRFDQKTENVKWANLYEFQTYTLHEFIMNELNVDGTSRMWVQSCHINTSLCI